jgi:dipeptidase D
MFSTLQPQALWQHFYAITQLPHPSGHTERIRQFLIRFAQKEGLHVQTDKAGNVIIRKPTNSKSGSTKTVILQAHMDMVPQKNSGIAHNFELDPLPVYIDGDWIKAKNTTLGADNGIGMAAILAVLESKSIKHGALVAIFTADEETGMDGAFGLDKKSVQGDYFLNLDSEEEGELIIGCAGGLDADFTFRYTPVSVPTTDIALKYKCQWFIGWSFRY